MTVPTMPCATCERTIDGVDLEGIYIETSTAYCVDCLAAMPIETRVWAIDMSEIALLHNCLAHFTPAIGATRANVWGDCKLCGAVLENAGDAWLVPYEKNQPPTFEHCPSCGATDVGAWADDGEADLADWWECGRCGADGAVIRPDGLTQNGLRP